MCGGLWWFAVVCGGLRWFAMVCGGLSFSHTLLKGRASSLIAGRPTTQESWNLIPFQLSGKLMCRPIIVTYSLYFCFLGSEYIRSCLYSASHLHIH